MDKSTKRAWTILGVIFALFMIGLFMVSMWGGPYQADSSWLKEETPKLSWNTVPTQLPHR